MDFTKYVWMLDRHALFFSRADRLGDQFEGSISASTVASRAVLARKLGPKGVRDEAVVRRFSESLKRFTFVNCWHMNEVESAAMWKLYLKSDEGVAVRSTYRRLTDSFADYKLSVYVGEVNYIDYEQDFIPDNVTFSPFLHKRRSFEHERELRAVRQELAYATGTEHKQAPEFQLDSEALEFGLTVPVRLTTLIERVYVAPGAPGWLRDLVVSVTERYGFGFDVQQSDMDADPVY
jgi:hypothetical protein